MTFDGGPLPESQSHYSADYGAMLIEEYSDSLVCKFITKTGLVVDDYSIVKGNYQVKKKNLVLFIDYYLCPELSKPI